eukprot:g610.t1
MDANWTPVIRLYFTVHLIFQFSSFRKKLSAVHCIPESNRAIAADRFGDLYWFVIDQGEISPVLITGHFCSIVTSLLVSFDGRLLCTSDRDGQTRVTVLPENPDQFCCEIQCFCMGHTKFISSSALGLWNERMILVTGGGDGLVLFFDIRTGESTGKFDVHSIAEKLEIEGPLIILSVAAVHSKPYLALLIENQKIVILLEWNAEEIIISSMMSLRMNCMPSFLTVDHQDCLWIIGGSQDSNITDVQIIGIQIQGDGSFVSCPAEIVELYKSIALDSKTSTTSSKKSTICTTLGKRKYSDQELETKHKQLAYVQHAEYLASVKNKSISETNH